MFYCVYIEYNEYNKRQLVEIERTYDTEEQLYQDSLIMIKRHKLVKQAGRVLPDGNKIPCNTIIDDGVKII